MADPAPELAVAAKRIAGLEADVANLRRGMVQQLTVTGKLMQAALAFDAHFDGRFLAGREPDPQEEVTIAVEILNAARKELAGGQKGQPATSPLADVAEVLRSELVAREMELAEVRRQSVLIQEDHGQELNELRERLAVAEDLASTAAKGEASQRNARTDSADDLRSDRAEALGLCAELAQLLQANPTGNDEDQITVQVLADALRGDAPLGAMCQAAERATVSWGSALLRDLADVRAQLGGLEALRATAGEWQQQSAHLRAELEKARAEVAKSTAEAASTTERCGIIEREITKLQTEREGMIRDLERLQVELGEQRRATHEANTARSHDRHETEAIRALEKTKVEQTIASAQAEASTALRDAQRAIAEREHAANRLAILQERIDQLEAERTQAVAELATARSERDAARNECELAQAKIAVASERIEAGTSERDQTAAEVAVLRRDIDAIRADRETNRQAAAAAQARILLLNTELETLQHSATVSTSVQAERDRFRAALDQAQTEQSAMIRARDEQASQLTLRLTETSRQLGELKQVQTRLASENDRLHAELDQVRKLVERGRTDMAESQKRAEALADEARQLSASEARANEADRRMAELDRRLRETEQRAADSAHAVTTRETQITQLATEIRRISEQLAAAQRGAEVLRKNHGDEKAMLAQLLVEARSAVRSAKQRTEQLQVVQDELAKLKGR